MSFHSHAASQHHIHDFHRGAETGAKFYWALVITLGFAVVEAAGGVWSGSLALLSDAGHMFTDSVALGLAAFGAWVAGRPPSARHSYGMLRAEVITALMNSLLMLALIAWITVQAFTRLHNPQPVAGGAVMVIAFIGLAVNVAVALTLSHGKMSLNSRAALLHVLGDMLGSVAALAAGAVIYFTGWTPIDPILSLFVAGLILFSSVLLLRQTLHVLMEGVPSDLQLPQVGMAMAKVEGVHSVHDLHIWTLSSGLVALSAHLQMESLDDWPRILNQTCAMLHDDFDIVHVTLQPEISPSFRKPGGKVIPIYFKSSE